MKFFLSLIFYSFCFCTFSQVGPYSWQDHTSLNSNGITVCRFNGKIYASNYNGLVAVDDEEGSTQRLNKINGLSDVGIKLLRVNPYTNKLLVIYDNANIDIIDQKNVIKNYPDIKLKTLNGKKAINEVFFKGKYAYLATGIGIILFDTEKLEIKDTYIIGPNGSSLEINQVTLNDSIIFAASAIGLYKANYTTKILNDFNSWKLTPGLPVGIYSGVISVTDKIITAFSPSKGDPTQLIDTLYTLNNGNAWSKFFPATTSNLIRKLSYVSGENFALFGLFGPQVLNVNTKNLMVNITTCNGKNLGANDIVFYTDNNNLMSYWVADRFNGLFQTFGSPPFYTQNIKSINGLNKSIISNIDVYNGTVAISPSFPNDGGGTALEIQGINLYSDNNWTYFESIDPNYNLPYFDINCVYFDRKDPSRIWASSWGVGLLEFKDQQKVAVYDATNTNMGQVYPGSVRASGLAQDKDGNLWIGVSDANKYLSVRKRDGTFHHFDFQAPRFTRRIMVDKNNYVWALHERDNGITVFKPDANFSAPQLDVNYRVLTREPTKGNLESNSVYSIAEDKDGKIWVGTSAGLRVFYTPANMFSSNNYDAQPIKIVQDGNVELLLEKETVSAIVVDGANNKWVGTQTSGVYCFSPDGLRELNHFTKANSPLYSDNIVDLNYNKVTGDIFIGTDLGLQSFRSPIIEGDENYDQIYAFPNPVKPSYTGNVFVRGLVDNSVVKVTDESGNLVWETKSTGGQVEWPVKNLSGARAASGVYVIYASTTNGELKAYTKVLVVN
jgi:hypothetical protein